jgi:hypothetical protein
MKAIPVLSILIVLFFNYSCNQKQVKKNKTKAIGNQVVKENNFGELGAGYRYSNYGIKYSPGFDYWGEVGTRIAGFFGDTVAPEALWIVGVLHDEGVMLNFPTHHKDPLVFTKSIDENEKILTRFDSLGYRVWLQIEPGNADVLELINIILDKYKHHSCIVGFGVDVEWYKSVNTPEGKSVTDEEANTWLNAIKEHDQRYKLFLKHWEINKMPPTAREDIVFVNDSQMFDSLGNMLEEFETWAEYFTPAKVGFQYGYSADKKWWGTMQNPVHTIGNEILKRAPNTVGLYWVDFTLLDIYPPK